jgi:hypothetical protein
MGQYSAFNADRRSVLPRMVGFRSATLRGAKTPTQTIVIRDLSLNGLGAHAETKTPALGESVVVTIESLDLPAMVKWVSRDLFGLHFSSKLTKAQLDALRTIWGEIHLDRADIRKTR